MNEIKGHRKCIVVQKFLENIEAAVAPPLPLVSYAYELKKKLRSCEKS